MLHQASKTTYIEWQFAWNQIINTNLIGPANISYCALKYLPQPGGRIINIGSRSAFRGEPEQPAYAAAKAGLFAMSGSLARDLSTLGISVSAVAPGFVDAGMAIPFMEGPEAPALKAQSGFNRVARAEEVAEAVYYLASPDAEFASGTIIDLNGASYLRL
nr:SDR family oxidoreductase [Paraflavitalea speifideiaquila]